MLHHVRGPDKEHVLEIIMWTCYAHIGECVLFIQLLVLPSSTIDTIIIIVIYPLSVRAAVDAIACSFYTGCLGRTYKEFHIYEVSILGENINFDKDTLQR